MIKALIKLILINIACFITVRLLLYALNLYIDFKPIIIKIILIIWLVIAIVLSVLLLFKLKASNFVFPENLIGRITNVVFIVVFICFETTMLKLDGSGVERGTSLYHETFAPVLRSFISLVLLLIAERIH